MPTPELQFEVDLRDGRRARLDFAWPDDRFAVEMDGFDFHWGRDAFERDRSRLNTLSLIGWTLHHVTWADATKDPQGTLERIERAYLLVAGRRSL